MIIHVPYMITNVDAASGNQYTVFYSPSVLQANLLQYCAKMLHHPSFLYNVAWKMGNVFNGYLLGCFGEIIEITQKQICTTLTSLKVKIVFFKTV